MEISSVKPTDIRYIKLGPGGAWLPEAISGGYVSLGYSDLPYDICQRSEWAAAELIMNGIAGSSAAAKRHVQQVRDFYELPESGLWFTFGQGHLWWTLSKQEVIPINDGLENPSRMRPCIGGWSKCDLNGKPLTIASLSSVLTKVRGYMGTICKIDAGEYLLRRIRGEANPLHRQATLLQQNMRDVAVRMIRELDWTEFETFIDLLFMRGGWRRVSLLGETMPDIDLLVDQPLTGERAWVQVKSQSSQAELMDYIGRFKHDGSCQRFFFACHTAGQKLHAATHEPNVKLLVGETLADLALDVGLFGWLTERTR